jgi:hypothetical protein
MVLEWEQSENTSSVEHIFHACQEYCDGLAENEVFGILFSLFGEGKISMPEGIASFICFQSTCENRIHLRLSRPVSGFSRLAFSSYAVEVSKR